MCPKDFYDSVIDDVFSSPKPARKRSPKRRTSTASRTNTTDFYDSVFYSASSTPAKRSSPKPRKSSTNDFDGIVNAYGSIKNMYSMTKRMHQQTKKVPTDNDEIIRRAKSIRAKEAKEKKVRKDRDYIMQHNEKIEQQKKEKIYAKHGYVEGNRMIQAKKDSAKKSKLNALRRFVGR